MPEFLRLQVFGSGLSPDISVGREWKPYKNLWWFALRSGPLLITWATAVCLRLRFGPSLSARELMLLLMNFVFLGLTMKARRFIEYWPIFCLLSAAFLAAPPIATLARRLDGVLTSRRPERVPWLERIGALAAVASIIAIVGFSPLWRQIRQTVECGYDLPAIREAMTFLADNSEPGDVVFTDDWDIFPVYFYYNSHNHYIVGLDPKFTHARRPELWERYVKVSRGQVPTNITVSLPDETGEPRARNLHVTLEDICDHFDARFVITDRDHTKLAKKLSAAGYLAELVYPTTSYAESRDAPYLIFRISEGDTRLTPETP
jgi:hypothetical protein